MKTSLKTILFSMAACFCLPNFVVVADDENCSECTHEMAIPFACPTAEALEKKHAREAYEAIYPAAEKTIRSKLWGVELQGTPAQLEIAKFVLGRRPPSTWTQAVFGCKTVVCALKNLFGNEESAHRVLTMGKRNGYVASLDTTMNSISSQKFMEPIWSVSELREIDEAFAAVPPPLNRVTHLKQLFRIADGYRLHNHSAITSAFASFEVNNNGSIVGHIGFYEGAFNVTDYEAGTLWPKEVAIHELCHEYDFSGLTASSSRSLSEQKAFGFADLSWEKVQNKWVKKPNSTFVSKYAAGSLAEDFAESCMAYLIYPDKLQKLAPEKYQFMKEKVFAHREYLESPLFSDKLWPKLDALMQTADFCKNAFSTCLKRFRYSNTGRWEDLHKKQDGTLIFRIYPSLEQMIQESDCPTQEADIQAEVLSLSLQRESDYCDRGGKDRISRGVLKYCTPALDRLIRESGKRR